MGAGAARLGLSSASGATLLSDIRSLQEQDRPSPEGGPGSPDGKTVVELARSGWILQNNGLSRRRDLDGLIGGDGGDRVNLFRNGVGLGKDGVGRIVLIQGQSGFTS